MPLSRACRWFFVKVLISDQWGNGPGSRGGWRVALEHGCWGRQLQALFSWHLGSPAAQGALLTGFCPFTDAGEPGVA